MEYIKITEARKISGIIGQELNQRFLWNKVMCEEV